VVTELQHTPCMPQLSPSNTWCLEGSWRGVTCSGHTPGRLPSPPPSPPNTLQWIPGLCWCWLSALGPNTHCRPS
jgi:hypothetical protein